MHTLATTTTTATAATTTTTITATSTPNDGPDGLKHVKNKINHQHTHLCFGGGFRFNITA
jgi:hypothetical protein